MNEHYDVIVIGSGAGGGTLTHALAPTGAKVLLLERGGWLPREAENWSPAAVWADGRYHNSGSWTDQDGRSFKPKQHYYVGGNTKMYGAILFRFRERDFDEVEHVDGVSPACRSRTPTSSLGTPAPNGSTRCTASEEPTRPNLPLPRAIRSRRSATNRGSRSSTATSPVPVCTRSRCRTESSSTSPLRNGRH